MSEVKARYVGHPDGVYLDAIPVGNAGDTRRLHIPYGGELPAEIDGMRVPASYRNSLLEQEANWTTVKRDTAKADAKEGDS